MCRERLRLAGCDISLPGRIMCQGWIGSISCVDPCVGQFLVKIVHRSAIIPKYPKNLGTRESDTMLLFNACFDAICLLLGHACIGPSMLRQHPYPPTPALRYCDLKPDHQIQRYSADHARGSVTFQTVGCVPKSAEAPPAMRLPQPNHNARAHTH